jgi:hypothetical protein
VGPYNVEVVRVFTRKIGAVIADVSFPSNAPFEAVIDCETGEAIHDMGARFEIRIDVIDFSAMVSIVSSVIVATGFLSDAGWPTLAQQFVFPIAASVDVNEGHIWKVLAHLKIGVTHPHTSLAESELFLITSP